MSTNLPPNSEIILDKSGKEQTVLLPTLADLQQFGQEHPQGVAILNSIMLGRLYNETLIENQKLKDELAKKEPTPERQA